MARRVLAGRVLAGAAAVAVAAFLTGPLLLVLWIGLSDTDRIAIPAGRPALRPVGRLLDDASWSEALRRSLLLAGAVAVLALAVGSLAAFVNVRQGVRARLVSAAMMILPGAVPTVVYALGLVLVSARVAVPSIELLAVGHVVLATPFAFLIMRIGLQSLRPQLVESARLLGASRAMIFGRVVLPQLLPFGVVSAALAGSISLAEPVLATFLLNDASATLPQKSFQGLRFSFDPLIMTAGAVIVLMTLAVAALCLMLSAGRGRRQ